MQIPNAQLSKEILKLRFVKGLGEDVYKLFSHRNENSAESAFDKLIPNKVTINFNMFGSFMKTGLRAICDAA